MLGLSLYNDTTLRKAKDLSDADLALCMAYLEMSKVLYKCQDSTPGIIQALLIIEDMLDCATLGNIDFEDVKKAPMRI